jgi:hypothetical protein
LPKGTLIFHCRKFVVAAALALSAFSPFAIPSADAAAPVIISAIPDFVAYTLTINGTDLCCKAASVLLGPTGPLAHPALGGVDPLAYGVSAHWHKDQEDRRATGDDAAPR